MDAAVLVDLFYSLSEEDQISAVGYLQHLAETGRERRAERLRHAFAEVDALLDGDTGWATEAEMIADLARSRRERQGL